MAKQTALTAIAIGALCVGVMIYVFDRQPELIYFLPPELSLENGTKGLFGRVGYYLPTFIHVYAFILLTVAIAAPSISKLFPICLLWFCLDTLFEFAQFKPLAIWIGHHIPDWFSRIPFLENTQAYFLLGTFDVVDLVSIATGAFAAYLTIMFHTRRVCKCQ
jgi:hypothetical protein